MIKFLYQLFSLILNNRLSIFPVIIIFTSNILNISFAQNQFSINVNQDPIEQALSKINLTKDNSTYSFFNTNREMLSSDIPEIYFKYVKNPFKTPYYLAHFKKNYIDYKNSLHDTLMYMTGLIGESVSRGYKSEPLKQLIDESTEKEALLKSIVRCYEYKNKQIKSEQLSTLKEEIKKIPTMLQENISFLIFTSINSIYWRDRALRRCDMEYIKKLFNNSENIYFEISKYIDEIENGMKNFDFKNFYCGALDLATAVERSVDAFKKFKSDDNLKNHFSFTYDTPLGKIIINNDGDTTYTATQDYFIIIDFEGNDFYMNCAATNSFSNPLSVLIDLDGDDIYGNNNNEAPSISFGSGIFGYGYLWDCKGNDIYAGKILSQASSFFGVGILIDENGNDKYNAIAISQAAGIFGLSLLIDKAGDDYYSTFIVSQGAGAYKGYGFLVDEDGNDKYFCNDDTIIYPSAQTAKHNRSLSQGCGMGYRGDMIDGHSLPGGIGRLLDLSGDDFYSAGVFAQGCGFWGGAGMLVDSSGNDKYKADYYVQGSGAHLALGILMDEDGDDNYFASDYMALGSGHDMTLGFFIDKNGNDSYEFPSASLGSGKDNGIGIFMDLKGDDKYLSDNSEINILGSFSNSKLGTLREDVFSLGFFMDAFGNDNYKIKTKNYFKNNNLWIENPIAPDYDLPFQKGVGIDGDFTKIDLLLDVITKSNEKD